jgi:hypothetical protein
LLGSFFIALWVSGSPLSEPKLQVTSFVSEDSSSQIFFSDEFGNFSEARSQTYAAETGINRLELSHPDYRASETFAYRFDPCRCNLPVQIVDISLKSNFVSHNLPPEAWIPGGTATLNAEGTYSVLQDRSPLGDPQVVIYSDFPALRAEMKEETFWRVLLVAATFATGGSLFLWFATQKRHLKRAELGEGQGAEQVPFLPHRPPLWLLLVGVVTGGVGLVQQFFGAVMSGVTVDEPLHVRHLEQFFASGVYSSDAYGPATALAGHFLNVLVGIEQWGTVSASAESYAVRHIAIAVFGLLASLSVALISRVILGHWGWGVVAAGVLSSFPVWVGHSMFNLKDVPLAAGLTMFTAGLVLSLSTVWVPVARRVTGMFLLVGGFFLGAGTRPIGIVLMLGALGLLLLLRMAPVAIRIFRRSTFPLALGVSLLVLFSLAVWGVAHLGLSTNFLSTNFEYPWGGWNLHGGERVESRPGLWTVIGIYAASTPLLVAALIVVGLGPLYLKATRKRSPLFEPFATKAAFALVVFQGVGAFLAVAVFDPVLYDNARQILFVIPGLAVIATIGLYCVVASLRGKSVWSRTGQLIAGLSVILGFVVPMAHQLSLFPYNYSYYNVVAQGAGVNGSWETDYWGSSIREAAEVVAPGDPATCRSVGDLSFNIGTLEPCAALAPYVGDSAVAPYSSLKASHFWVIRSERTLLLFGPVSSENCEFHSQVTRQLRGENVSLAWVYQCEDR